MNSQTTDTNAQPAPRTEVLTPEVLPKEALEIITRADVEPGTATQLKETFATMFADADKWLDAAKKIVVTDISQTREMKMAREMRLTLRKTRCNIENTRKSLKADALAKGKAIDGIANILKALIEPVEAHLQEQEDFAQRAEEQRKRELNEQRRVALSAYADMTGDTVDYSMMSAEMFEATLLAAKNAKEQRDKEAEETRIRAEQEAERQRKEAEERERIAEENRQKAEQERIRAEQERAKAERIRKEEEAKAEETRKQREEEDRQRQAERDAEQRKQQAEREKLEADRRAVEQEKQRIREAEERKQREEQQRREAEIKAEQERLEREKNAPDVEKIAAFVKALSEMPLPQVDPSGKYAYFVNNTLKGQVAGFVGWINNHIK